MTTAMKNMPPSFPPSAWLAAGLVYLVITLGFDLWPAFGHFDKAVVVLWTCWKYWREKKRRDGSLTSHPRH